LHTSDFKGLVESVRNAGDIVRLVSEYVPLKPAGVRLKGLCPFHQEKTPSFSVDPKSQLFYCFGCQTGGDVFKFVQLYEKLDFREAVEMLAGRWGVPLPAPRGGLSDALERLQRMNETAASFFAARLADAEGGQRARAYLRGRGIGDETVARMGLGYAPASWDALRTHLLGKRFAAEEILAGGLAIPRKEGRGEYDRFRDRVMFPIRDVNGRPVAFGGRCLDGSDPKYINSPETAAYVKGSHLYGLHLARDAIRREAYAIVVEGYLDLAALLQAGFAHAVASLGTAFTAEQARLLARCTDRVVVSYDGDAAGQAATVRTLDLLLEKGFDVRVAELPAGLDPDDFLRAEGGPAYERKLREAPGYLEFLLRRAGRTRDLSRIEEKVLAVNEILPRLTRLPSAVERASWAGRIADELRIEDDLVVQELRNALKSGRGLVRHRVPADVPVRLAEAHLVVRLLTEESGSAEAEEDDHVPEIDPDDLAGTRVGTIVATILRLKSEEGTASFPKVLEALESEDDRQLLARIAFRDDEGAPVAALADCVLVLHRERLVRERKRIQHEIEQAADPAVVDALLARKQQLSRQIDSLSRHEGLANG
jgi:DNA primase